MNSSWKNLLGKTIDEAEEIANKVNHTIRVLKEDGQNLIGTMDLRGDRINVEVNSGKIVNILSIG